MSKPKYLDSYTRGDETIAAINSEYAIVATWTDLNEVNEDRIGLFVTRNTSEQGVFIDKAKDSSKILGITVESPGFASRVDSGSCSNYDSLVLHPSKAYVCFSGFVSVRDEGGLAVGDTCRPDTSGATRGYATKSYSGGGYKVIQRIDSNHVLIHLDPLVQIDVDGNKLVISY